MSNARAVRYRRLALEQEETAKADLLHKIADESDRGLLCTTEWLLLRRNERPPKAEDVKELPERDRYQS
jgi:hypothetical protein